MMIRKGSWHYHLFRFGTKLVDILFANKYGVSGRYESRFQNGTNLCHYMRVIMVYIPLMFLLWGSVAAFGIYCFAVLPFQLFGLTGVLNTLYVVGILATAIVGIIGALWVVATVSDICKNAWHDWRRSRKMAESELEQPKEDKGPSFLDLTVEWVIAKKKNVCPLISFNEAQTQQ